MNSADLAQIRALLQASTPPERSRPRGPFDALRALLTPAAAATAPAGPPARRVGLRPTDDGAAPDLDPAGPDAALEARRRAFGQRHEGAPDPTPPLMLAAPSPRPAMSDDAAVAELLRRRAVRFAPAALSPAETPYHPEDLADHADGAAQVYAQAGLFEAQMDLPLPEPAVADEPERALLRRLEQVLLSEQAALQPSPAD